MKGKRIFAHNEAHRIRYLINKKVGASKSEQKIIRKEIRGIRFYFSDFSSKKGYTVADFDDLVRIGEVKITGNEKIPIINKKETKKENSSQLEQYLSKAAWI
jgi:dGTP triphosphohydrolase